MERYRHTGEESSNWRQFVNKVDKDLAVLTAACYWKGKLIDLSEQEKEHAMNEVTYLNKTAVKKETVHPFSLIMITKKEAMSNNPDMLSIGRVRGSEENKWPKQEVKSIEKPISLGKEHEGATQSDFSKEKKIVYYLHKEKVIESSAGNPLDRYRWKPFIASYPIKELRALTFEAEDEISRAVDMCYDDPTLLDMPLDFADGTTMIVPQEAVALLRSMGFEFEDSTLLSLEDLSPEEVAEMRQQSKIKAKS